MWSVDDAFDLQPPSNAPLSDPDPAILTLLHGILHGFLNDPPMTISMILP